MSQSKKLSLIEVISSTFVGHLIAVLTQMVVFPLYGIPVYMSSHLQIAAIFTAISIIRGYIFRRLFNWICS